MKQIKRSLLPFIIIVVIAIILIDWGDGAIEYEQLSYDDVPVQIKTGVLGEFGPGSTGFYELDGDFYAFIGTEPHEKAVIEFVGDAHDGIGKEVRYSVSKLQPGEKQTTIKGSFGEYIPVVIRIEKRIKPPFGFYRVDQ